MKLTFLAALLLSSTIGATAAMAGGLHGFADRAHYLSQGGQQVTRAELAANPGAYFAPGAYALMLDYFALTDAQFMHIVKTDTVVMECNGAEVKSLAYNDQGRLVPTKRNCVAGEQILVQKSTGRVLLLLGCLNPVIDWVIALPKAVPVVTTGGGGSTRTPPPPPPPPPCDDCNPPPDDGCGDGGHGHHGGSHDGDGHGDEGGGDHHGGGHDGDQGDGDGHDGSHNGGHDQNGDGDHDGDSHGDHHQGGEGGHDGGDEHHGGGHNNGGKDK